MISGELDATVRATREALFGSLAEPNAESSDPRQRRRGLNDDGDGLLLFNDPS